MNLINSRVVKDDLQPVSTHELAEIIGGYVPMTTVPALPDRGVGGCGTMILMDLIFRPFR